MKLLPPVSGVVVGASLALGLLAPPLRGQAAPDAAALARADSLVASWVEAGRVPGAVLRVEKDERVLLEKAYGWSQLGSVAMDTGTVFDLASVTKVMATTFAVMRLVDRGELDVDAPVSRYLPDFRGGGKDAVTLRHLLTHRAGLVQWVPTYYHATDAGTAYAYIRDLPLAWPVGEGRHYSDLSFMLLGRVVEQVTGVRLDRFLSEDLYGPLGLRSTGFRPTGEVRQGWPPVFAATSHGNPYEHRMVHDSTFGYRITGDPDAWNGWRRYTLAGEVNDGNAFHAFGGVAGHAGLFSTAAELGTLLRLLLNRGTVDGRSFVRPETVDAFLASTGDGQALGWQVPDYAPSGSLAHTGFTGTYVLGVPRLGLGVVLLTNRQNLGVDERGLYPDVGPLQRAVARNLLASTPSEDRPGDRAPSPSGS